MLLTCFALLFIIIYESEYEAVKKEEESHIDYNLLEWIYAACVCVCLWAAMCLRVGHC